MSDMLVLVDTAVTVPVNIFPLTDAADFVTRETAVAYNETGMDLVWNFQTPAGVTSQTAVTPTTSGTYDWSHMGDGMYKIEIPASGGASINNDTEGFGWFSGIATGILAWRGPIIQFAPANVVNSLAVGSDLLDVSVTQWLGTPAATPSVAGVPEVDITHVLGSAADLGTSQTGDAYAELVHVTYGLSALKTLIDTIDNFVDTEVSAIKTVTDALTAAAAAKLALSGGQIITGTVDTGSFSATTTEFEADDITEATANHYNGRSIIFTSGAVAGQACTISDYALSGSNGHFTVPALTEAPANNVTFIIV